MNNTKQNILVVQNYFNAFKKGNMDEVLNAFHKDCLIVSVRQEKRTKQQLHGIYKTKEEAKQFVQNLISYFNPKEFVIDKIIGDKEIVFSNGSFVHQLKSTNKIFKSDWAQRCIIEEGKIKEYRFYEDSAAFVEAFKQ